MTARQEIPSPGPDGSDGAESTEMRRLLVSALADGETDGEEAHRLVDAVLASTQLRAYWSELHRVGDCLRSDEVAGAGDDGAFMQRFAARLAGEPSILAPDRGRTGSSLSRSWFRAALPGASIAAALLVVGWMVMPFGSRDDTRQAALSAPAPARMVVAESVPVPVAVPAIAHQSVDPQLLSDYLAAHQQLAPSAFRSSSVQAASFGSPPIESANPQ